MIPQRLGRLGSRADFTTCDNRFFSNQGLRASSWERLWSGSVVSAAFFMSAELWKVLVGSADPTI
jgi:hypothetical protein